MLSTHLHLGLPSSLFPYDFPTNSLYAFLFFHPFHPPRHKSWSSLLCSFLHYPVTSSPFSPNILLRTLFSNTPSLCSSLNVRDQVSPNFFCSIWWMQKIWAIVDLLHQKAHWWFPVISSVYQLILECRIFNKILYEVDRSVGATVSWRLTVGASGCRGTHQFYSSNTWGTGRNLVAPLLACIWA
jgi:hypothetical protein